MDKILLIKLSCFYLDMYLVLVSSVFRKCMIYYLFSITLCGVIIDTKYFRFFLAVNLNVLPDLFSLLACSSYCSIFL